jgi:hypothetical protein
LRDIVDEYLEAELIRLIVSGCCLGGTAPGVHYMLLLIEACFYRF